MSESADDYTATCGYRLMAAMSARDARNKANAMREEVVADLVLSDVVEESDTCTAESLWGPPSRAAAARLSGQMAPYPRVTAGQVCQSGASAPLAPPKPSKPQRRPPNGGVGYVRRTATDPDDSSTPSSESTL